MRLHPSLIHAVASGLENIFESGYMADRVVERLLKSNPKWGSRDRAFIAEHLYDIVRYYRRIHAALHKNHPSYVELVGTWLILNGIHLPDWKEFSGLNPDRIIKKDEENAEQRAIRESIPDWLDQLGSSELPDRWDKELKALNEQAELVLRVNSLKVEKAWVRKLFSEMEVDTVTLPEYPDALILEKRMNVFRTNAFRQGMIEVQDASSQLVAPFLQVEPGMRVVDACAGGGGKSLHLAALMQNKGRIISMDVDDRKLKNLRVRAARAGADIIETRTITHSKIVKRMLNSADRLLLDVPCSGLGVLRRNPDAKWKLSEEMIKSIQDLQADILGRYAYIVKPGGMLVYATCSILPSENFQQVDRFLKLNPQFILLESRELWPSDGFDGFYMARLLRNP